MDLPARLQVRHRFHGDVVGLTPESDGYLGSWSDGTFDLEASPLQGVEVLKVDQESDLTYPRPSNTGGEETKFVIPIQLLDSGTDGLKVTKHPSNHIKLVRHDSQLFQMWEVAIVTQAGNGFEGNFFLTTQLLYRSPIFRNKLGKILLPEYEGFIRWPQLQEFLDIVVQDKDKLPFLASPPQRKTTPVSGLKANEGVVIWYNLARGYGAIATGRGNARVHWSQVVVPERFRCLREGQKVTFGRLEKPTNSYKSPRVTNFQRDAVEVRPA